MFLRLVYLIISNFFIDSMPMIYVPNQSRDAAFFCKNKKIIKIILLSSLNPYSDAKVNLSICVATRYYKCFVLHVVIYLTFYHKSCQFEESSFMMEWKRFKSKTRWATLSLALYIKTLTFLSFLMYIINNNINRKIIENGNLFVI